MPGRAHSPGLREVRAPGDTRGLCAAFRLSAQGSGRGKRRVRGTAYSCYGAATPWHTSGPGQQCAGAARLGLAELAELTIS